MRGHGAKFGRKKEQAIVSGLALSQSNSRMSFFITSSGSGNGAALDGLAGADQHCQKLATAVGAGNKTWRAYLSAAAAAGQPAVNARDRIGKGPWYNAKGVMVAKSLEDLHSDSNNLKKETSISEKGEVLNGRGDNPNQHDILTGSPLDGTVFPAGRPQGFDERDHHHGGGHGHSWLFRGWRARHECSTERFGRRKEFAAANMTADERTKRARKAGLASAKSRRKKAEKKGE
jgi:hypothetical protein